MLKKLIVGIRKTVKISVLIVSAIAVILAVTILFYNPTYSVSLNGEIIGYTANKSQLQTKINNYIENGDTDNVAFIEVDNMPEYELCYLRKDQETNDDEIYEKVASTGTTYYKFYAITEENEEKAYVSNFQEAEDIVKQLKEKNSSNKDKIGIVEKYDTQLKEFSTVADSVNKLYKKKVVRQTQVASRSTYVSDAEKEVNQSPVTTSLGISLIRPVSGVITSRFGIRSRDNHKGLDIGAPKGTAIQAAAGGTVIFSGYGSSSNGYNGYGNVVVVRSTDSVVILYAHCSSLIASTGETVSQGQVIGRVGSTGISTGNHLHFEIRYNGRAINPQNYVY